MTGSSIGAAKQITRELEKKYNLHPAERKERAERPELKKVDYAAGDVKHQIGNTVKAACYGYRFQSFGEYKALLAAYNVRRGSQSRDKRQALSGHCLFRHERQGRKGGQPGKGFPHRQVGGLWSGAAQNGEIGRSN